MLTNLEGDEKKWEKYMSGPRDTFSDSHCRKVSTASGPKPPAFKGK